MEATALSVGKSVLNGALSYAKSAVAEELALQLGVGRDQTFITGELEMMQSFLMSVHDEGDGDNKVVKTWVKQVRDVAYIVEDCLQDFAVRVDRQPWWRTLRNLHDVAKQMKELRAQVDDVSQRNIRYQLIKGSSAAASSSSKQQVADKSATALLFGIHGAAEQHNQSNMDLAQLLMSNCKDENNDLGLGVISVWVSLDTVRSGPVPVRSDVWTGRRRSGPDRTELASGLICPDRTEMMPARSSFSGSFGPSPLVLPASV